MADEEPCGTLVQRTGRPDGRCLQLAASHIRHDLSLLELIWRDRHLRIGWTLWFVTARSLMDFFFRFQRHKNHNGTFKDDILAADYLADGIWQQIAERLHLQQPPDYKACREAANKLSAHLTYSRVDAVSSNPSEPSRAVHEYLLGVAAVWLAELSPEHRVWFGKGLSNGIAGT